MSAFLEKLRAVRERIAVLRANGIDNSLKLGAQFSAIEKISPDVTCRHLADTGRFLVEDQAAEFDTEATSLIELLDGLAKEAGARNAG